MLRPLKKPETKREPPHVVQPALPAVKPPRLIAEVLNGRTTQQHRTNSGAEVWVHVSDLIKSNASDKFCPREYAINALEQRRGVVRSVMPGMELLFKVGHAVQDHITDHFIARSQFGHTVWGDWRCPCHATVVSQSLKPANVCTVCKQPVSIYVETLFSIPSLKLVGHPDLLLLWNNELYIYEIKTIDRSGIDFKTMDAPLGDHTLQATFYYWMARAMFIAGRLPYDVNPKLSYIYADRGRESIFQPEPFKEFDKRTSPKERIEPKIALIKKFIEAVENKHLPGRICDKATSSRAVVCPAVVSCFARRSNRITT